MTTPHTEPNSLPELYVDWIEWREAYAGHVEAYNKSQQTFSDGVLLEIRLKRLGFSGLNLFNEVMHIRDKS